MDKCQKSDSKNDVQSNTVFLALVPCLLVYVFGLSSEVISEAVICLNARSERDATDFFKLSYPCFSTEVWLIFLHGISKLNQISALLLH